MGINFIEPRSQTDPDNGDREPKHGPTLEGLKQMNFGFGSITLDTASAPGKTIATLPIQGFLPSSEKTWDIWREIRAAIGERLSRVAGADALLVDLRDNNGGDPSTVAFVMSYLLDDGPKHLLDFVDRSGKVDESFSTLSVAQSRCLC
jgi:C-terminal processing protease CtpA/Prc